MEVDDVMAKAMEAMGWNMAGDIPMANEENQALIKELEEMAERRNKLRDQHKQTTDRVTKLLLHKKNAKATMDHNMKLIQAHQEEMRTLAHLLQVFERECSKMKQDNSNLDKELKYIIKYEEKAKNDVERVKKRIEQMTNRIKWVKDGMLEWQEAMDDGVKGCKLIEKYAKEDKHLFKEQEHRRHKLNADIAKKRAELVRLYDEQKCLEQNLDCTSQLYRAAHAERRQMIETWKIAVNQMTQREKDIINAEKELENLKAESKKKAHDRKMSENKLDSIIANNRAIEKEIEDINSDTADIKANLQKFADLVILKENEIDILQKELQGLTHRVEMQRAENGRSLKQQVAIEKEISDFDNILAKLEKRTDAMKNKNMTAQQRLQMLEDMTVNEEKIHARLTKEITASNGKLYRAQEQLAKYKNEEKTLTMANAGIEVTITAIKNNMEKMDKQLKRITEDYYNQSFKCLQLERKLENASGPTDPEQKAKNKMYLQQLEEQNLALTKRLQQTESENRNLDGNMKKLTMAYNADYKKTQDMLDKLKAAEVYYKGGVKLLKERVRKNQLMMVELSLLKLRIKQSEEEIADSQKSSYNLEQHRLDLNKTINDRMVELKSQHELILCKRKHLIEENNTLKADIGERNTQINALKTRFELTSELLGRNEDGSLVTATQLKVELAQEKQLLIEQGNDLNERNLRAEQEITAMENTLKMFKASNEEYRKHYQKKGGSGTIDELSAARREYCEALAEQKEVHSNILKHEKENAAIVKKEEIIMQKLDKQTEECAKNSDILEKVMKEIEDQKSKIKRAERELKLAKKRLKEVNSNPEFLDAFEKELDLRELEDSNMRALCAISEIAENDFTMGPTILKILEKEGLKTVRLLQKKRSSFSLGSTASSDIVSISSQDNLASTPRSSATDLDTSSAKLSVVSIEFPDLKK